MSSDLPVLVHRYPDVCGSIVLCSIGNKVLCCAVHLKVEDT